jgi:hypothetical protein
MGKTQASSYMHIQGETKGHRSFFLECTNLASLSTVDCKHMKTTPEIQWEVTEPLGKLLGEVRIDTSESDNSPRAGPFKSYF